MDISRDAGGGDRERFRPNETVSASQLDECSGPASSEFLFVHVTGDSAVQKHGNHSAIRSHVAARVGREFREVHKTARKRTRRSIRPKNPLLGPQHHDSNCPSSMTAPFFSRSSLTFSVPDGNALASTTNDLHTGQQALPEAATVININLSPFALAGDSSIRDIRKVDKQPKASISYCKACGRPVGGEGRLIQGFQSIELAKGYYRKNPRSPSPVEILGAGRVDPFLSYPMKLNANDNELLDHLITYKIPGLFPDDKPTGGTNSVSIAWLGACQKAPLLFHALLFSSSIHLDFIRRSKFISNSPTNLSYKLLIFRLLTELMREGNEPVRDEVILAILELSSHEVMPCTEEKRNPFQPPLTSLQFLNVYGTIKCVPQHKKAVLDLISLKGGIEEIQLAGLAECLVLEDIITSMNSASKPTFPPLRSHETYITAVRAWAISPSRKFVQNPGSKFCALKDHGMTDATLQLFDAIGSLTIAIDHYLKGEPDGLTVGEIARTRTAIQKLLLLLPQDEELSIMPLRSPCVYEACRLTGLIFGIAVVFPMPNTYAMLSTLTLRLKASIEKSEISRSRSSEVQYVLLWMLILGGIAAMDKMERPWFVSQLVALVRILEMDWDGVEEILENFLWLESACGSGGRSLWSEVMECVDSIV